MNSELSNLWLSHSSTHVEMNHTHTKEQDKYRSIWEVKPLPVPGAHSWWYMHTPTSQAEMDSSFVDFVGCQHKTFQPANKIPFFLVETELNANNIKKLLHSYGDSCSTLMTHVHFTFTSSMTLSDWCLSLWPSPFVQWFSSSETKMRHLKLEMTGIYHHGLGSEVVSNAQWPGTVIPDSRSARSARRSWRWLVSGPFFLESHSIAGLGNL